MTGRRREEEVPGRGAFKTCRWGMRWPTNSATFCPWRHPNRSRNWSLTSLKEKLIKIGAKIVSHGRYVTFRMAEVAIPRTLFGDILRLIAGLRPLPVKIRSERRSIFMRSLQIMGEAPRHQTTSPNSNQRRNEPAERDEEKQPKSGA